MPSPDDEALHEDIGKAAGTDYFFLRDQLSDQQWDYLTRTRHFVQDEVLPVIADYWERADFPLALAKRLGELGLVGDGLVGYGCPPMDPLSAGLVQMELSRGDGSLGTFLGVQAGLAMRSIAMHGSDEQKERWLGPMARVEKIGAFALTEPEHGSDSIALETSARRDGDSWVISGTKTWIGNASIADVVVVWARDVEDKQVKGFLVEKGMPGFSARVIDGKGSLRAIWQAEVHLKDVRVPVANRLPGANSFKDTGSVLVETRSSCAWMALGHAVAGYDAALTYAKRRHQFGRPLSSFQIVQGPACEDACRRHRDAAVLRPDRPIGCRGPAPAHDRRPRQASQHAQGATGAGRGPRPARRQRNPSRLPRHQAHG